MQANVTLTWALRPASENVTSYVISELTSPGREVITVVAPPPAPATTGAFVIQNVSNGLHSYVVTAVNSFGEGVPSATVTVNIFAQPFGSPGIPANVNASVNYSF